jgi:hypothetical protein
LCALSDVLSPPRRSELAAMMHPVRDDGALAAELTNLAAQLAALRSMTAPLSPEPA